MAKYVKCGNCGKKILFGEYVYLDEGNWPMAFCSPECLIRYHNSQVLLDAHQAEDFGLTTYDEDTRKRELQSKIAELQRELDALNHT